MSTSDGFENIEGKDKAHFAALARHRSEPHVLLLCAAEALREVASATTLKAIFLGHRELFDGLAIAATDYDWKPHAVIHFNWGRVGVGAAKLRIWYGASVNVVGTFSSAYRPTARTFTTDSRSWISKIPSLESGAE